MNYPYASAARRFSDTGDRDRFAAMALSYRFRSEKTVFKQATKHARHPVLAEVR